MDIPSAIKNARRVSAPLIAVTTPDPAATIAATVKAFAKQPPVIVWDCFAGWKPANKEGERAVNDVGADGTEHWSACLSKAKLLPGVTSESGGAILFMHNAHKFLDEPAFVQGVWNLRDKFKQDRRTLILLAPAIRLPAELANDVLVFDQPLPTESEAGEILAAMHREKEVALPDDDSLMTAAVSGLSAFMIEQVGAMSLTAKGMDMGELWSRKVEAVEQTPGLKVWRGGNKFKDIGGMDQAKRFLGQYLRGKKAPRVIVYIDEIEKQLAGIAGDTSGTSQDQLGQILAFMQDEGASGVILYGPAGTGKSNLAKAAGNETGIPVVAMDMGAMKNEHVGESEGRIRAAFKAISAMGQKRVFFIATCNTMAVLPPELRRRFKAGTFFMDLPTKEERAEIWKLYMSKFDIKRKKVEAENDTWKPNDEGWTGAEIETCCEYADNLGVGLKEAAAYIVPVAKSASDVVEGLRKNANGRFLSANKPGLYEYSANAQAPSGPRAIAEIEE